MKYYIVKHKNFEERLASRSGGIFTALSDFVLKKNGIVFGTILNENLEVVHTFAETVDERNKMRGSKYVQSIIGNTYIEAKNFLESNKLVLFTGTPCQIAGLKSFLNKEYDNLITLDIICHNVPSPQMYYDFLNYIEKKYKKKIVKFNFRNKYKYGWASHLETIEFDDGSTIDSNEYGRLFYSDYFTRPNCFKCKYKNLNRVSDITIGDAWGIEKDSPEFNDNNGVSIVLVNTRKMDIIFNEIMSEVDFKEVSIEPYLQKPLKENYNKPVDYDKMLKVYRKKGIRKFIRILRVKTFKESILRKLKK